MGQRRTPLDAEIAELKAWTTEYGHEARRLREVDSLIGAHHRTRQPSLGREQGISRNVERDVGIDLGHDR